MESGFGGFSTRAGKIVFCPFAEIDLSQVLTPEQRKQVQSDIAQAAAE